ncbi:MAG: hemolysin family protein [Alphaproteobacteria bacterium]
MLKKIFGPKKKTELRETIEDLIDDAETKDFSEHEQLILTNVLELKDTKCSSAMIARANIVAFQKDGSVEELANLMINKGHSRIPVYNESLDDIEGVVHVIDLVKSLLKGEKQIKISELQSREVAFVPPSMPVLDLLKQMQKDKTHLAIVINEYGGTEGLVTIEDLLEEIVGDIEDEYDLEEDYAITVQQDGSIIADARIDLDELLEKTDIDLKDAIDDEEIEIDTLGGLVFHLAQRIPTKGEKFEICHLGLKVCFKILDVDPRRIKKVLIIKNKEIVN